MKHLGARMGLKSLSWRRHKRTHSFPEQSLLTSHLTESIDTVASAGPELAVLQPVGQAASSIDQLHIHSDNESVVKAELPLATPFSKRRGKKLERYSSQLGLDEHEVVLKVCPCFLVSELLVQGCLIVTERHVCFHSNMFGKRRRKKIKFEDILQISKEKVYALFPTGIGVTTATEKVTFSSATSRDRLVQLLRQQQLLAARRVSAIETNEENEAARLVSPGTPASLAADGWVCGTQSPSTASCVTMATRDSPRQDYTVGKDFAPLTPQADPRFVDQEFDLSAFDGRDRRCYDNGTEICTHRALVSKERAISRRKIGRSSRRKQQPEATRKLVDPETHGRQNSWQSLLLACLVSTLIVLIVTGLLISMRLGKMEHQVMLTNLQLEKDSDRRAATDQSDETQQPLGAELRDIIQALGELQGKLLLLKPMLARACQ
ncbi:hypothetical protein BOX15_Mlig012260g2 [Macrostomum lignano]|uniref:GRAM domain-containing protein n=1 Tax=Macrostomum lignano TaxID=282301 RepID=A0A267FTY8_9PLAT|nr:hypothetical protein BOX15_Mlig012260g2 [Macrostomum lignano]